MVDAAAPGSVVMLTSDDMTDAPSALSSAVMVPVVPAIEVVASKREMSTWIYVSVAFGLPVAPIMTSYHLMRLSVAVTVHSTAVPLFEDVVVLCRPPRA